ncbi:PHD finger protein 7-like isoform X2 [Tyto alba]|uniref:PHD finger protein 7-like isoform X2 n=1 Tax=Tyto alba TaxID=56313 RepID=UPI001C668D77|nr:PHD finger protein 7-like isoform X2 [Tyto alba]
MDRVCDRARTKHPGLYKYPHATAPGSVVCLPRALEDKDGLRPERGPQAQPAASWQPLAAMELRSRRRRMSECPTEQCPPALPEEQARPSCAPPKRKRRCPISKERVCGLCRQDNCDADMVGQLCQKGGLCVHENCLHRPVQRVRAVQQDQTLCLICQEGVAERPCYDTLVCPACASAWFHRGCIQGQALRSGFHYFCCPLCRNREQFLAEMFHLGIRIPDRDAAWEEEDGAFAGHYLRHSSCDANQCLCPEGREHVEVNG